MRRIIRSIAAISVLTAGIVLQSGTVKAATAGAATTSSLTPPAAVTGLTIRGVTSALDGGMYFAYQNATGDDYSLVKQKADKSFDSTFGIGGVVTIPGLQFANASSRRILLTSDLNNKWWTVSLGSGSTGNLALISTGGATGQPTAQATFAATTLATKCAAAFPSSSATSWNINGISLLARRGSGVWALITCSALPSGTDPNNSAVLTALKADLSFDSAITPKSIIDRHGSSVQCHTSSTISDPTGDVSSPEIWVVRAEHTKLTAGICDVYSTSLAATDVSGYDVLRISSSGTITRTTFASAGDSTDAFFSVRLDPGGRPLLVGTAFADNTKMVVARLNTNGALDTTSGTNGFRTLPIGTVPAGATSVRASVMGIITSPETVYISVLLTDQEANSFNCSASTPRTWGYRVAVISYADGFANNFGSGGIGDRVTTTAPEGTICQFISGGSSVTTSGAPRIAYTNGTAFSYSEWVPPAGTTGGSDGGTGTGGYTKDTGGAPSLGKGAPAVTVVLNKLPSKINMNNAYKVLSAAQAKKHVLNSITPAVCFGAETYVIAVSSGTCTVRIKQISNGSVVRTLRSTVVKSAGTAGSAATPTALLFKTTLTKVTAANTATIASLASKLSGATLVVVSGHAASVTDSTAYNESIARKRALNVKAAILKTSSKTKVATVNLGVSAPVSTKKAESSQAKNRRAVIYIIS